MITTVFGDDWEGMYIDDTLVYQGHSLRQCDWYRAGQSHTNIPFEDICVMMIDQEYLESIGELPKYIDEIPKEVLK